MSSTGGADRKWVGGSNFAGWVNSLEGDEIRSADDLHAFCEEGRAAAQYVAALLEIVASEVGTAFKDADRYPIHADEVISFDAHYARRFGPAVKELHKMSDCFEAAAKHAYAAWLKFEKAAIALEGDRAEATAKHNAANRRPGTAAPKGFDFRG